MLPRIVAQLAVSCFGLNHGEQFISVDLPLGARQLQEAKEVRSVGGCGAAIRLLLLLELVLMLVVAGVEAGVHVCTVMDGGCHCASSADPVFPLLCRSFVFPAQV